MTEAKSVMLLGVPLDENSSFLRGPALAPARIRETLYSDSANMCAENGLDLGQHGGWHDGGDLAVTFGEAALAEITAGIDGMLRGNGRTLSLGGDHSITYPIIRAYAQHYPNLNILQIDAHPDLYHEYNGNRYAHGCPFARIMEAGLATRLVQMGIRTMNPHQREQAERFGVEVLEMHDWSLAKLPVFEGPLYVSLDMDALDPAFAPGVSHHEPGGFSTRELLTILQRLQGNIVGADIVEYNPMRDVVGVTGMTAVKLLKELLAKMLI